MSNSPTEQSIQESIESTGGIPEIEVSLEVSGMMPTPVDKSLSIPDMAADAKATGDAINTVSENLADTATDVATILGWTAADIPVSNVPGSGTIADALADVTGESYPVGSIYMTVSTAPPMFTGTWVEIAITATWAQLKTGKRGYAEFASGETGGDVHFWLRTE